MKETLVPQGVKGQSVSLAQAFAAAVVAAAEAAFDELVRCSGISLTGGYIFGLNTSNRMPSVIETLIGSVNTGEDKLYRVRCREGALLVQDHCDPADVTTWSAPRDSGEKPDEFAGALYPGFCPSSVRHIISFSGLSQMDNEAVVFRTMRRLGMLSEHHANFMADVLESRRYTDSMWDNVSSAPPSLHLAAEVMRHTFPCNTGVNGCRALHTIAMTPQDLLLGDIVPIRLLCGGTWNVNLM